jgi:putative ABC transport system substrate-binding protein
MRRRDLIATVGAVTFLYAVSVRAQQAAVPVIGLLSPVAASPTFLDEFPKGLAESGYRDGQNVSIEFRSAEGHDDRLSALAIQLVQQAVDVIVTTGTSASVLAAKNATSTIPIVFLIGSDPVAEGLVASLARPGGNLTGVTLLSAALNAKRFELLSELVPQTELMALLVNPSSPGTNRVEREVREAAGTKRIQLQARKAENDREIDDAFALLSESHVGALVVGSDPFFASRRDRLIALAARYAIPAIYEDRRFVAEGGLIGYGSSPGAVSRQLGIYAGKILAGAKPADLPVIQPTKFELVVNLRTAKALGLAVPQSILARADEVIE